MDPTPNTNPTPSPVPAPTPTPPEFEPIVELIRTQRANVGYALTVLAAAFLIVGVMLSVQSNKLSASTTTATDKEKDKDKDAEDPHKPLALDGSEVIQPNKFDYICGAIGCALGLIVVGSGAAYLIVGLPKPTESEQRREARVLVLAVGGLLGAFLILIGILFFYRWSESLVKWLDKGEIKEARWVLIPLLMVVTGGGIMFTAVQPARTEERNNTTIRRLVYGSNFGLTILILFVVLIIANAVIAMRMPNKLDFTHTGIYTLNPQTKQLVETLDQPIRAYAIFQDGADEVTADLKRLLENCQYANPSKFQVTFLSPALNRSEINKLRSDYPLAEMSQEGVLLVAGDEASGDRKRHTFIRADELEDVKPGPEGKQIRTFVGEPKLLRELLFLAENKQKPKIYFTQSSGELSLGGGGGRARNPRRSAANLRSYLEKNYFEVVELNFDLAGTTKVPDDASAVVVADPTVPLAPNAVTAIQEYMDKPRADGKKGKLVVLAGAQAGPDGKSLKIGLEPLLGKFGVRLPEGFLYAKPLQQLGDWDGAEGTRIHLAAITQDAVDAKNIVALNFNKVNLLPLLDCREVQSGQGPGAQAVTVLMSPRGRLTWVEQVRPNNSADAWRALIERARQIDDGPGTRQEKNQLQLKFQSQMQMSTDPRELAVFVTEQPTAPGGQPTARVAVFGCGWFVSDDAGVRAGRGQAPTLWLDLMGSTLDWVRDRPVINVPEKEYAYYTLKPGYDQARLIYLPLGIGLLLVLGMGAGVWVIRRK